MRKIFFVLLPLVYLLTSCDDYGKKVSIGKNEVYYKGDGATEADAKKLGDFLKKAEYFNDSATKSVQLTKQNDAYVVRLVVDKDKIDLNDQTQKIYFGLCKAKSVKAHLEELKQKLFWLMKN